MSEQKKRKRLSFREKYEIFKEIKKGVPKNYIMQKYNLKRRILENIVAYDESDLFKKVESCEFGNKKTLSTCRDTLLDNALITWFTQARHRGDPLSGPIIQEKALILNKKLNGSATFKVSM